MSEPGSETVRALMADAEVWFACRVAYVETMRAVTLAAGRAAARHFVSEWPAFAVVEVDQRLVGRAAELTVRHGLRSLAALHLAAALLLPVEDLAFVTWDSRLHMAGRTEGLAALPDSLS